MSTSLDALPSPEQQMTPPVNTIQMEINEPHMNEVVSGIQKAANAGVMTLPPRDVPLSSEHITHDEQVDPTFIPRSNEDYMLPSSLNDIDIANMNEKQQARQDSLDMLYDELQVPILIGTLYFLFQLPILKIQLLKHLPSLFKVDGNLNIQGFFFTSTLFAVNFYAIQRLLDMTSTFT